jgi:cytochrome c oxidase assembly protein subunit 15
MNVVQTWVKRLSVVAAAGMFLVLIQGTLVTNTGSADGCGNSWPLCNGEFIPRYTLTTAIEFSHRAVVGIESFLIIAVAAGALWFWRQRREVRILAPVMVGFLFLQAALGAAAVMWPQSDGVIALHFGVSLIAFASTLLLATFLYEMDGRDRRRDIWVPRAFSRAVWGLAAYTYVVVYIGAYVRHSNAGLACSSWPTCNGDYVGGFQGSVGVAFGHRLSALVLTLATAGILYWAARFRATRPELFWSALLAMGFVVAQALSGAVVVLTKLDQFATLSHGILVAAYFGSLAYLCFHVLPRPAAALAAERSPAAVEPRPLPVGGQPRPAKS